MQAYLLQMQYLQDSVFYRKMGELKREKKSTNGVSGWKTIYIHMVLSELVMTFPKSELTE
jgi:hypothetical protein